MFGNASLVFKIINRVSGVTVRTFMFRSDAQAAFDKLSPISFKLVEVMEAN